MTLSENLVSLIRSIEFVDIHGYKEIWANIKRYHEKTLELQKKKNGIQKVKITKYLEYWRSRLKQVKEETEFKFDLVYKKSRI